jgi:hypothetical protein
MAGTPGVPAIYYSQSRHQLFNAAYVERPADSDKSKVFNKDTNSREIYGLA